MGDLKKFKRTDWDALAAQLRRGTIAIDATEGLEEQLGLQFHEATPEEIVAACESAGAKVAVTRDAETGEIDSIEASVARPITSGVVESIDATGPTPSKILGDLAQTSVDAAPVSTTGSTTISSTSVTVTSATGIVAGQSVSGAGIPAGTDVASISGTTVTLTQPATATASNVALTFTTETQVLGLAEWTLNWKRKTADATTTDDDTYESSLGSTASWSVKAKYMFIDGDTSQAQNILATITSPQSPTTWNFFPTIGTGRAAFSGSAYVDGIDIATGMGKVVGLDVSLKGTGKLNFLTQAAPVANPNTGTGEQAEV